MQWLWTCARPATSRRGTCSTLNIPLAGITERANEISKNKECTILCYCAMGSTSQQACQRLQKLGYSHVHSLKGGINGWQAAGLPITRK